VLAVRIILVGKVRKRSHRLEDLGLQLGLKRVDARGLQNATAREAVSQFIIECSNNSAGVTHWYLLLTCGTRGISGAAARAGGLLFIIARGVAAIEPT
jgi:hypothetical protein